MARLDELERKFEENPRRYFAPLANEYRKTGDARRAVDLCRAQLPGIPGHISGHIVLGQALFDVRDYPGSRSVLETALSLDPENIVALRYLGDIARDSGDPAGAERWYTRTLEADPFNEAAQAGLDSLQAINDSTDRRPGSVAPENSEQPQEPVAEMGSSEVRAAEAGPLEREDIDSQSHAQPVEIVDFPVSQEDAAESLEVPTGGLESLEHQSVESVESATTDGQAGELEVTQAVELESADGRAGELEVTQAVELESADGQVGELEVTQSVEVESADGRADALEVPFVESESAGALNHEMEAPQAVELEATNARAEERVSPEAVPPELVTSESVSPELVWPEMMAPKPQLTASGPAVEVGDAATTIDVSPRAELVQPLEAADPSDGLGDPSSEFAGDLDVSSVAESVQMQDAETALASIPADSIEPEPVADAHVDTEAAGDLLADVEAHRQDDLMIAEDSLPEEKAIQGEDAIQAEERVLEAAAPFVTETMADLYMEQGHPHEALELMLQLSEQRPDDESLRAKIELIESAILARRDAAVAAARAERSEATLAHAADEISLPVVAADAHPAAKAPFDPAGAEVDESAFSFSGWETAPEVASDSEHEMTQGPMETVPAVIADLPAALSVREMFARMDATRPRVSPVAVPKLAPALRSDFVPIPQTQIPTGPGRKSDTGEHRTGGVSRSSGPHQTFDPSTAGIDDFDAWLRGLRGP